MSLYAGHFPGTRDYDYGRINKVPHPPKETILPPTRNHPHPTARGMAPGSSITLPPPVSPLLCLCLGGVQCGRRHGGLGLRGLLGQRLLHATPHHTMHTHHLRQYEAHTGHLKTSPHSTIHTTPHSADTPVEQTHLCDCGTEYPPERTVYNNVTHRTFNILVETSNQKDPTDNVRQGTQTQPPYMPSFSIRAPLCVCVCVLCVCGVCVCVCDEGQVPFLRRRPGAFLAPCVF